MASSTFGSDVLFKMVMLNTSTKKIAASTTEDLASRAMIIGGSAEVTNAIASEKTVMTYSDNVGYIRLESSSEVYNYIHITLPEALQEGDIIHYEDGGQGENHTLLITRAATRARYNNERNKVTAGSDFSVPAATDELRGASELWIWNEAGLAYIKSFTITRSNVNTLAKEYIFSSLDATTYTAGETNIFNDEITIKSDGGSTIQALSGQNVYYTNGGGNTRYIKLSVTDPCTIEVWGIGSAAERKMHITDNTSSMTKWDLATFADNSSLVKGSYHFDGTADNTDLYISSNTGSMQLAAIRVVYDRIRPAANFSVSPAKVTLRVGESQLFTFSKDYEGATISRSAGEGSDANWIYKDAEEANVSVTLKAKADGAGHTYVMRLTQKADAYCRNAVVDVPIRIIAADETATDIVANEGTLSDTKIWTSADHITLAADAAESNALVKYNTAVGEFAANTAFRLASGKAYTISVPSNKQISKVTFSGYSLNGTGSIEVNGERTAFNAKDGDIKDIVYSDINAQKFNFSAYNQNVLVRIVVITTDLGHYPVTIGSSNWASFCAPEDVELPSGVFAYIAESKGKNSENEDVVVVNKVESSTIPAGGYLLYSEAAGDYALNATTGAAALDGTNLLVGTTARTVKPAEGTTYVLNSEGCLAPYTGNYIPGNKAYLHIPADPSGGAPARIRLVIGGEQTATAIESIQISDIRSQKVIENGQLVIIKNGVRYNAQGQIVK